MLVSRSTAEALPTRFVRLDPGKRSIWRTEYLGPPPSARGATLDHGTGDFVVPAADSPQSFRIEQEAGIVVQPHFHFVNQFQVVVAGSASIGRNDATPITVHYAGAHTGYGPVTAGPQGVTYFTLRAQSDGTGAQYLPAARARMQKGPKRYILADPCPALDSSALASLANAVTITMIDEADGIVGHFVPFVGAPWPVPRGVITDLCVVSVAGIRFVDRTDDEGIDWWALAGEPPCSHRPGRHQDEFSDPGAKDIEGDESIAWRDLDL